jgi:hypothetical protein
LFAQLLLLIVRVHSAGADTLHANGVRRNFAAT